MILGGGPAGLGAAWRLHEAGHTDWELFEKEDHVGGLASSYVDDNGFTWDLGGHVVFSHYDYFDCLLDSLLKDRWVRHERQAWVWMRGRFIPYPLQNNIRHLPTDELLECLSGLLEVRGQTAGPVNCGVEVPDSIRKQELAPGTFADWIVRSFGAGLARVFMNPYNFKVWATDPAQMSASWVGERVATVDLKRILRNVIEARDDLGWGPNATFRFPLHGGTGQIWRAIAEKLPADRLHLGTEVTAIDAQERMVDLSDGRAAGYDWLITTMPLDLLLRRTVNCGWRMSDGGLENPDSIRNPQSCHPGPRSGAAIRKGDDLQSAGGSLQAEGLGDGSSVARPSWPCSSHPEARAGRPRCEEGHPQAALEGAARHDARGALHYSSTHVVGVGLDGPVPERLATKCWMYFPEPELPFYRVTVFSNYSPNHVPHPGRQWSLMAEVSESANKSVDHARVVPQTVDGLKAARLIGPDASIVSVWHKRVEHGYPTPFLQRDALLDRIEPALYSMNILSRGRFGAWKYEVGNMDHSFMQGVEAVNHILFGEPEMTLRSPAVVNAQKPSARMGG